MWTAFGQRHRRSPTSSETARSPPTRTGWPSEQRLRLDSGGLVAGKLGVLQGVRGTLGQLGKLKPRLTVSPGVGLADRSGTRSAVHPVNVERLLSVGILLP